MAERKDTPFTGEHFAAWCEKMGGPALLVLAAAFTSVPRTCSTARRSSTRAHYTSGRVKRYKDDIAKKKVCADCVGGCKGYAWTNGGVGVLESIGTNKIFSSKYGAHGCPDKSANGMFSYAKSKGCAWGDISTLPEIPGIALRFDGHVGYYVGNGYAVEWRGFNYGCVRTRVKDRPWTHWYKLPFIDYSAGVVAPSDEQPEEPRPVNTTVVIVSGGGKVNVRTGNGTGFGRITAVAPGTTYEYVATAANGWNAVVIGSRVGWVSGYSRIIRRSGDQTEKFALEWLQGGEH